MEMLKFRQKRRTRTSNPGTEQKSDFLDFLYIVSSTNPLAAECETGNLSDIVIAFHGAFETTGHQDQHLVYYHIVS